MKKTTKLSLFSLIEQHEVGEMAYNPKGVQAPKTDKESGERIIPKFKPHWKEGNQTDIPDYWLLNPTQQEGQTKLIVPLDCNELAAFVEQNKEWLDSIGALHDLQPELVACKRGKYQPRNTKAGTPYIPSGERYSVKENILRGPGHLNDLIKKYFANDEIRKVFETRSIPVIEIERRNLDRYGQIDNNAIEFTTLSFNSYMSSQDFLDAVVDRIDYADGIINELPDKYKSYPLARQFNKIYSNWEDTKKNKVEYKGKTDVYMLDRFGLDPDNLDVTVKSIFKISGKLEENNNRYVWFVSLKTEFGRKLKEEPNIKGGLSLDKEYTATKVGNYDPGTRFNDQHTVLDNFNINTALVEALHELQEKIKNSDPIETLEKANYDQTAIQKLNEDKLNNIIQSVLKEIKK